MPVVENWVEVFKVGTQTDSLGRSRDFTEEILDSIIDEYNARPETERKAPVIKGHEETGQPKFGEVLELKRIDDTMYALVQSSNEEFIKDVRNGEFDAVSIAINEGDTFRHLAVLGAEDPAVTDLEPFTLSKEDTVESMNFKKCEFTDKVKSSKSKFKDTKKELIPTIKNITLSDFLELLNIHGISINYYPNDRFYSKSKPSEKYFSKNYIEKWNYAVNVPIKDLTKDQLIKTLEGANGYENKKDNISNKQYEEGSMEEKLAQLFTELQEELTTWSEETFSPEVATQFSSKFSEVKENYIAKIISASTEDGTEKPEDVSANSNSAVNQNGFSNSNNPEFERMQKRIEELETKDRIAGFNENINSLVSKGILEPKQKESLFNLLNATHTLPVYKFSKGGTNSEATVNKMLLEYTESFGSRLSEGQEFTEGTNMPTIENRLEGEYEFTQKVKQYADENKLSFREAYKQFKEKENINK